jgi:hypothetical protein
VPETVGLGPINGVHPINGSMMFARSASSEALLMTVASGIAARSVVCLGRSKYSP